MRPRTALFQGIGVLQEILGLTNGEYELNGCVVGYAAHYPTSRREFDLAQFVTPRTAFG